MCAAGLPGPSRWLLSFSTCTVWGKASRLQEWEMEWSYNHWLHWELSTTVRWLCLRTLEVRKSLSLLIISSISWCDGWYLSCVTMLHSIYYIIYTMTSTKRFQHLQMLKCTYQHAADVDNKQYNYHLYPHLCHLCVSTYPQLIRRGLISLTLSACCDPVTSWAWRVCLTAAAGQNPQTGASLRRKRCASGGEL